MPNSLTDLRRLPSRSSEVWQLVVIPMTGIRVGKGPKTVEPRGCFIADQRTHQGMSIQAGEPDLPEHELACASVVDACTKRQTGYVPGVLQVRDPELAALIRPRLAPHQIRVDVADSLPAVDELVEAFKKDMMPPPAPGWLEAPGMTLERLSVYAQAAAMMFKAAPWQHLANEDLIQIESPKAPRYALRFACIMGAGGEVFGISFSPSRQSFDRLLARDESAKMTQRDSRTSLIFSDTEHLPPGDAELWLAEHLPLADDHAYPSLLRYPPSKGFERLDGPAVTFVEGLCRALAQTSEEQIDAGRWEQTVPTGDGPATYILSIPSLLEAMNGAKPKPGTMMRDRRSMDAHMLAIELLMAKRKPQSMDEANEILARELVGKVPTLPSPSTPLEEAQWLCFEAFEHQGRRRIQLARQALAICPDAADAYCLLAEQRGFDTTGANDLYRQGMEAGRRALGEEPFNDPEYRFWGAVRSRPYMRARQGFAQTLLSLGRKPEAAEEFQAMLKLNPNDNQGIRYELAPLLLELNRLDELDQLLNGKNFQDDGSAEWAYVRALLAFRRTAGGPKARSQMIEAIKCNPHVSKYLLGRADLPPSPPRLFSPGDEQEAMIVASSQKALWEQTPQAIDWLGKCKRQLNRTAQRRKPRRKR